MVGNFTSKAQKARYWWCVLYPENMLDNWEDQIADIVQIPYEYCIHDKDLINDEDETRKVHVHMILCFANTTTYKNALSVFQRLSRPGGQACNKCEAIISMKFAHDYLIHDTDKCRECGKFQYSPEDRASGNNFDIGAYVQLDVTEQEEIFHDICDLIVNEGFTNFADLHIAVFSKGDYKYDHVLRGQRGYFEALVRGLFHKKEQAEKMLNGKKAVKAPAKPEAGAMS